MKTRAKAKSRIASKAPSLARTAGSTKTHVTATEAARKFSEILNRVAYKGESFVVERGGHAVCEIRPAANSREFTAADFIKMMKTAPRPDDQYFDDVEEVIKNRQPVAPSPWQH
jgi:antitoxin (DNA-binding transcriptional repressor) of toxin-antitoxin stability system